MGGCRSRPSPPGAHARATRPNSCSVPDTASPVGVPKRLPEHIHHEVGVLDIHQFVDQASGPLHVHSGARVGSQLHKDRRHRRLAATPRLSSSITVCAKARSSATSRGDTSTTRRTPTCSWALPMIRSRYSASRLSSADGAARGDARSVVRAGSHEDLVAVGLSHDVADALIGVVGLHDPGELHAGSSLTSGLAHASERSVTWGESLGAVVSDWVGLGCGVQGGAFFA